MLSVDTDNVFVCLSATDLNPDLTIVARALDDERGDEGEPDSDASDSGREEHHREAPTEIAQRTNLGVAHRGDRYHRHVEGFVDPPSFYDRVASLPLP